LNWTLFEQCARGLHSICAGQKTCSSETRGGYVEVTYCECDCGHKGEPEPVRGHEAVGGEAGTA
jgi:hypothetical protein